MILKTLWIQRKERYKGEYAPEMLAAVDEYTNDDNPDLWPEKCDKALRAVGDEVASYRVINIELDREAVFNAVGEVGIEAKSVVPE